MYRDGLAGQTFLQKSWSFVIEADLVGMFFLGATITLIFLPLVLAGGSYASTFASTAKYGACHSRNIQRLHGRIPRFRR